MDYYLIKLVEECGEVIKATSKVAITNFNKDEVAKLQEELADAFAIMKLATEQLGLDTVAINKRVAIKYSMYKRNNRKSR